MFISSMDEKKVLRDAAYLSNCTVVDDPVQFLTLFSKEFFGAEGRFRPWY
jgi:hypothetical protein